MSLEEADEMLRIFESQTFANHRDGQRLVVQQLFGMGEKVVRDDVLGGTTSFNAYQIPEISAGQTAFVCKISYRWQTVMQGFCGDIIIK